MKDFNVTVDRNPWERSLGRPRGRMVIPDLKADVVPNTTVYIPTTFDPRVLVPKDRDCACWMLNAITQDQRRYGWTPEAWVPLPQAFLRTAMEYSVYQPILRQLQGDRVIEMDRGAGGENCRCYRLLEPHRSAKQVAYTITKNTLLKRMYRFQVGVVDALKEPVHQSLRRWLSTVTVADDGPDVPHLDELRRKDFWMKVCDYGRIHTGLTSLPKRYRHFIRLAGHSELYAVDVSHCQFVLMASWLRREGYAVDSDFVQQVLGGRLYDTFGAALGVDREKGKDALIKLVYGLPRRYNRPHGEVFQRLYPQAWDSCMTYSRSYPHEHLSLHMQRLESKVMIGSAAHLFTEFFPDEPLLTIHDALVVPRSGVFSAESLIKDAFDTHCDVKPTIKKTLWTA